MIDKLIHVSICDDHGEFDAFFTPDGELLHLIDCSDAHWESAYMEPLLLKLGLQIERISFQDENWRETYPDYFRQINDFCGWNE